MEVGNKNVWIFWQKPKMILAHEKCMNDPFFHEGYSPGMYEFTIKHGFYQKKIIFQPYFP
jgi:hypothetical protein